MDGVIELDNVRHTYRDGTEALRGVSLTLRADTLTAVIGHNGSGKTTLVKHLNGLLRPTNRDGAVRVRAGGAVVSTRDRPLHVLAATVGYVFQNPDRQIFHDTCREELAFGLANLGVHGAAAETRIAAMLERMGLSAYADANPAQLSRGERQRLAIAATLVMEPAVVVVDEPTTGQDRHEARAILQMLAGYRADGHLVVIVSHDMALVAEHADRIIAMRDGAVLADGPPREVFASPEILESTNIRPPQIAAFAARIGRPGPLTVGEAVAALGRN